MFSVLELRALVNTAIDILHGLDQGNEILIKCQDTLRKFLIAIEIDGNKQTRVPLNFPKYHIIANQKIPKIMWHILHPSH